MAGKKKSDRNEDLGRFAYEGLERVLHELLAGDPVLSHVSLGRARIRSLDQLPVGGSEVIRDTQQFRDAHHFVCSYRFFAPVTQ